MQRRNKRHGLVSQAEYARITGVNRSTICREIKTGKIPVRPDGLIDVRRADRARRLNLDVSRPSRRSGVTEEFGTGAGSVHELLNRARAVAEMCRAEEKRLDLAEYEGKLLRTDAVRRDWTARLVKFESRAFQVADIVAPRIAAMTDAGEIRELLMKEVGKALAALREDDSQAAL